MDNNLIEGSGIPAFDDVVRDCQEPANHLIGEFDFLNSSGRREAAAVRSMIEHWLTDYPEQKRQSLVTRLRSRDNSLHRSAFFELLLHALLLRKGFEVIEIEPKMPNGRAPDFLVRAPDGGRFYLEATLASGVDKNTAGAEQRMREAIQAIDKVKSPDFFLCLQTSGVLSSPVSTRKLLNSVQHWVDGLDYAAVVKALGTDECTAQVWQHDENGAHFTIKPIPKNQRCPSGRAIGVRMLPREDISRNLLSGRQSRRRLIAMARSIFPSSWPSTPLKSMRMTTLP